MHETPDIIADDRHDDQPHTGQATMAVALGVAMSVAALYLARDVLVPLTLAALLSFALSPPMLWMRRRGIGRVPSVAIVVTLAFIGIFGLGRMVVVQVAALADNLPAYEQNLQDKIRSVQGAAGDSGILTKAQDMLRKLNNQIDGDGQPRSGRLVTKNGDVPRPVPVQIQQSSSSPVQLLQSVIGPLIAPLANTGLIVVFVISFLLQRENLRDRFIRLVGSRDLHRTTEALNEAGSRVARYLFLQLTVNLIYSVPVYFGLHAIGVPNALLWALLVVLMRFVPYVGIVIAAIFPLALSLAVDPHWDMVVWTATLFISLELVSANLIEPWLYGVNTGLSPVAIIVAATFWTWLWGPVGLLLSTPLTVCLVVLGRHAPPLRFLHVLLGNDAPLAPSETFYQRLLADDSAEAAETCEALLKERNLGQIYDEVVVPALALAQDDSNRGELSRKLRGRIREGIAEVIETFAALEAAGPHTPLPAPEPGSPVLCVVGRNDLDEAATGLLVQLLHKRNIGARLISAESITSPDDAERQVDVRGTASTRIICLSYMSNSPVKARLLVRKLRRKHLQDTKVIVGFWGARPVSDDTARERLTSIGADEIVTSLQQAVERIAATIHPTDKSLADLVQAAANAVQQQLQ
jgi:predicted PurR-regulated permease PerM